MGTLKCLFSFYGRLRRSHFAYFIMFSGALWLSIGLVVASNPLGDRPVPAALEDAFAVAAVVLFLLWLVTSASFTVRRLHDMSLSGWFYVLFLVAQLIPVAPLLILAWLLFGPGTKGVNSFGPDPRAPRHAGIAEVFDAPA